MASTVFCSIVSAEQEIFAGQVEMVVASGTIGELGILPGHTPLLSGVKPGPVRLILEGGEEQIFFASGGFIEVQPTSITILADTAMRADDLDEAEALEAKKKAELELSGQRSDIDFARVTADLQEQAAMLRTIQKVRNKKR
ncbi:MAG: F0F1 ATP synthase subunit epsilon [Gammaproteobacteria bacterium]|jgi:F-type H+-transporting ATPase subunit epsilon|nr:F0F1 ATP synthase subunit epsilon [Gammaproteobacteria bacterium]MDE0990479.1 F0F1 ATP synthase subunit epsilon [Pseudomonadales bacterium]MBT3869239.1 F0F1 ATP synthase subunit epsilon [Gammaproteobacteria bacterium]MBT4616648.1 F0F1 ATP synthase subunit epsilon [Gammaproteobacteria bacterium]MBT5789784.1 F0F1 ATP synthase subunit epsilon [Gammaproteobacteria bacterium]|tara:strand:- start:140 stop:562 length:423 start_codon:yes stop_codon:yes gene_type:complete